MAPADDDRTNDSDAADTHNPQPPAEVSRRDFLKTVGAGSLAATTIGATDVEAAPQARPQPASASATSLERAVADGTYVPIRREVADNLRKRGVVGYADRLRAQPGETVKFMVSCERPRYRADIVRLIHGDANPKGPGIKEVLVDSAVSGEYPGIHQDLPLGSYATVPDDPALRISGSFTMTAWMAPTTQRIGAGPKIGPEGLVTKWAGRGQGGYGVFIDESGRLALWLADAEGRVETLVADPPLRSWIPAIPGMNQRPQGVSTSWYFVAVSFDAAAGTVVFYQDPINTFPFDATRAVTRRTTTIKAIGANNSPLFIAAYQSSSDRLAGYYNGKIDNPRLYRRALTAVEIDAVKQGQTPAEPVASWDFSRDIGTTTISDTSSRRLHGLTVNLPMRAVTGHNWTSSEMDFKRAADQYGAIYFHDDDIEDARWEVGFEFRVPDSLKSGLYAARLRSDTFEDYVPFVVRPKKGAAPARIALLIPTFSYLAYGGTGTSAFRPLSLYSRHSDGSGVCYSSRLRPITNMRPKIDTNNPWQFMADTHLIDWLETKGFAVDFYTDEDLHFEGAAVLAPYKAVVTATHPEYYSLQMLNGLRGYLESGGRLMYLGGNGFYWVTAMDATGRYVEVRRRDGTEHWQGAPGEHYHSVTGESGGLWRFRGLAPQQFFGVGFTAQGFDRNCPYKRMPDSFDPRAAFIFDGIGSSELIGNHPSLVLEFGAAGSELDRADFAIGTPPHTLVLASSFGHSDAYQHVVEQINTSNNAHPGGSDNPLVRADMAYLEYPKGGAVFSSSAIAWCGSLSFNNYNNNVSRVTENVLRRFVSDEPLPPPAGRPTGVKTVSQK